MGLLAHGFVQVPPHAVAAARSAGSGSAASDDSKAQKAKLFADLDTNHDGVLSRDEVINGAGRLGMSVDEASALFSKLDSNNDGVLSLHEFESMSKTQFFRFAHHKSAKETATASATSADLVGTLTGGQVPRAQWYGDAIILALVPFLGHCKFEIE